MASDGYARISYYDVTNGDLKFVQCTNAACSGSNVTSVDTTNTVGLFSTLKLGLDGLPRIAYYDATNTQLLFVSCDSASCASNTKSTLDSIAGRGQYASMVIGLNGHAKVGYYDSVSKALLYVEECADCASSVTALQGFNAYTSSSTSSFGYTATDTYLGGNLGIKGIGFFDASVAVRGILATGSFAGSNIHLTVNGTNDIATLNQEAISLNVQKFNLYGAKVSGTSTGSDLSVRSWNGQTSNTLQLTTPAGTNLFSVSGTGQLANKATANSSSAFQIQNFSSNAVLTVDTSSPLVQVGSATTNGSALVSILDSYNLNSDPTGVNGGMYFHASETNPGFWCFNNGSWTSCLSYANNLQSAYASSSTPATITTTSSAKTVAIVAGSTFDSSSLFTVQNSAGNSVFGVDSSSNQTLFGKPSTLSGKLTLYNATNTNTVSLQSGVTTASVTFTLPVADGTNGQCIKTNGSKSMGFAACVAGPDDTRLQQLYDNSGSPASVTLANAKDLVINAASTATSPNIFFDLQGTGDFIVKDNGTAFFSIKNDGTVLDKSSVNSTTAFQIQNASAAKLVVADTTNLRVYIGDPTADATAALLVVDTKNTAGDPTGVDGAIYYNSNMAEYRCYRDTNWEPCLTKPIDRSWMVEDEFLGGGTSSGTVGNTGWSLTNIGAAPTLTYNNATPAVSGDRPGILRIATTTTINQGGTINMGTTSLVMAASQTIKTSVAVGSAANPSQVMRVGLHTETSATTQPLSGVWWEANPAVNANWRYCYGDGTTATCAASGTAIAANTVVRLEIRITAVGAATSAATFYINGTASSVTGVTIDSTNKVSPAISCYSSLAGTAWNCFVDYFMVRGDASAAR
jgi:hypothetical protein